MLFIGSLAMTRGKKFMPHANVDEIIVCSEKLGTELLMVCQTRPWAVVLGLAFTILF